MAPPCRRAGDVEVRTLAVGVRGTEYELLCLPLRIRDGDVAPARVLLRPR